jgi:hypothetical protein
MKTAARNARTALESALLAWESAVLAVIADEHRVASGGVHNIEVLLALRTSADIARTHWEALENAANAASQSDATT